MKRFTKFIVEQTLLLNEHVEQLWKQFEDRLANGKFNKMPEFVRGRNINPLKVDDWKEYLTGELDVHPKAHHPWLLSRYMADPKFTEENFEHASYLLKKLSDLKKVGAVPENITSKNFKTFEHLNGYVSTFVGTTKYPSADEYRAKADATVHSENEHWQIVHVKNHQAACKFGMDAKWCTAGTDLLGSDTEHLKKIEYDEQGNLKTNIPYDETYRAQSEDNFRGAAVSSGDELFDKRGLFIAIPKSAKAKRSGKFQFSIVDHGDLDYDKLGPKSIATYFSDGGTRPTYEIKDENDIDPHFMTGLLDDSAPKLTSKFREHDFPEEFVKLVEKPLHFYDTHGPPNTSLGRLGFKIDDSYDDHHRSGGQYKIPSDVDEHLKMLSDFFYENPHEEHPFYKIRIDRRDKVTLGEYNEFVKKLPIQHYSHFRNVMGEGKKLEPLISGDRDVRDASYRSNEYYDYITDLGTKWVDGSHQEQQLGDVYRKWEPKKRASYFADAVRAIATAGYHVPEGPRYGGSGGWTNKTYNRSYTEHKEALGPHYLIRFFKDMYHPDLASAHDNEWIKYTKDQLSRFAPYTQKPDEFFKFPDINDEIENARENGDTLYHDVNLNPIVRATFSTDSAKDEENDRILKAHQQSQFPFVSSTLHHLNKDDYDYVMKMANKHLERFG